MFQELNPWLGILDQKLNLVCFANLLIALHTDPSRSFTKIMNVQILFQIDDLTVWTYSIRELPIYIRHLFFFLSYFSDKTVSPVS